MKRKVLSVLFALVLVLSVSLVMAAPVAAATTWTVDDDGVECPTANYATIQAAINAASPGDTINVYPGTYDPQIEVTPPGLFVHLYAQGIVVWKDGLTIQAVDPDPSNTIIRSDFPLWMEWWRIQRLTGGMWIGPLALTGGFNPQYPTSPSALVIVASGVTVKGFTFHRPYNFTDGTYYTAGVMIGGVAPGDPYNLGKNNNIVEDCAFSDVWHAVYIWHSSGNQILNNTVASLNTNHWAAISVYDGYNDQQIALGNLSENNLIVYNTIANKGIALGAWGAWAPPTWTSLAGSKVCCNSATQVGVTYAHGPVIVGCNSGGFLLSNADEVIRIKDITYTGDAVSPGPVNLSAQLDFDGSADGSGVEIAFSVGGTTYSALTEVGGVAAISETLAAGVYTIETKVTVCDCCEFTDTDFLAVYDPTAGFVTGGGWIESPEGAYVADPALVGKANFGFVSKYVKGKTAPEGNTEFQFKAGNLNFKSTSYDWLVIAGARAQYKGVGTINGLGSYGFMLTAIDGRINGGGGVDKFRIKIWEEGTGSIVYDNKLNADDTADPTTTLGGGSIVIHK